MSPHPTTFFLDLPACAGYICLQKHARLPFKAMAMIEHAEYFADRTLKRTLVRVLGHMPTPVEERCRTEIVHCEGPLGPCQEYRLDGRALFQHRLTREGYSLCSDILLPA